jgi:hypothetical protein
MAKLATGLLALWLGAGVSGSVLADEPQDQGQQGQQEQGQGQGQGQHEQAPPDQAQPAQGQHEQGQYGQEEHEQGTPVSKDDLPAPVKATFDKEAKGGQVEELHKETKNGKTYYRGEIVKNGKATDLKVSESGKVLHKGKQHNESNEKGEQNQQTK